MAYNFNYEKCVYFREKVRLIVVPEISVAQVQGVKSKNSEGLQARTTSNYFSTFYYEITKHQQVTVFYAMAIDLGILPARFLPQDMRYSSIASYTVTLGLYQHKRLVSFNKTLSLPVGDSKTQRQL